MDSSFLLNLASGWLRRIPPDELIALAPFIKHVTWGSACSGTDAIGFAFCAIRQSLGEAGIESQICHIFSCDLDAECRRWISFIFNPPQLFGDIQGLSQATAFDYATRSQVQVSPVDIFVAGFVCKSLSAENSHTRDVHCLEAGTGSSGVTWQSVLAYLRRHTPSIAILENVKGLKQVLHYVVGELQSVGYIVGVFHLDSLLFALPARRERIYLLCFFRGTTEHLACARRFMEIFGRDNGTPNIKSFLVAPSEARLQQELDILLNGYYRSGRQVMACNPSKRRKWLTEHCNSAASSGNLDPFAGDQSIFECWPDLLSLTPRERDMLAVHGVAFPEDPPGRIAKISTSCSRLEFTDGAHIPTLTTRSRYYMTDLCRCVRGRELLRLQGIFALETATDVFTDKWMAEAAGNAFSAPVCLAAVLASMLARALCD